MSDLTVLTKRIVALNVLSDSGWILEETSTGGVVTGIAFQKQPTVRSCMTVKRISLNANLEWMISLIDDADNTFQFPKYLLPNYRNPKACSVTDTMQLLKGVDDSCLCIGNPDPKFDEIRDLRKGKFMDQRSTSINNLCTCRYVKLFIITFSDKNVVAYHDTRLLPLPTIRSTNCQMFISPGQNRCMKCDEFR